MQLHDQRSTDSQLSADSADTLHATKLVENACKVPVLRLDVHGHLYPEVDSPIDLDDDVAPLRDVGHLAPVGLPDMLYGGRYTAKCEIETSRNCERIIWSLEQVSDLFQAKCTFTRGQQISSDGLFLSPPSRAAYEHPES